MMKRIVGAGALFGAVVTTALIFGDFAPARGREAGGGTTVTGAAPISVSGGAISCTAASAGVAGCVPATGNQNMTLNLTISGDAGVSEGLSVGRLGLSTDGGIRVVNTPITVYSSASTNLGLYVSRDTSSNAGVCFSGTVASGCRGYLLDTGTAQALVAGDNVQGLTMNRLTAATFVNLPAASELEVAGNVYLKATAPTITSACTSPTVTHGLSHGFQIDVGTSCTGVTTVVLGLPATTNGWRCDGYSKTTSTVTLDQTADTTTSATLVNTSKTTGLAVDFVDGADLVIRCTGR